MSDKSLEQEIYKFKSNRFFVEISEKSSKKIPKTPKSSSKNSKSLGKSLKDNIVGKLFSGLTSKTDKKLDRSSSVTNLESSNKINVEQYTVRPKSQLTMVSKNTAPAIPKSTSLQQFSTIKSKKTKRAPLPPEIAPLTTTSLSVIKRRAPPAPTDC